MTPTEATAHLQHVARRLAPLISAGILSFAEAADGIDRFIWTDPRTAKFTDALRWSLSENAHFEIVRTIDDPTVAAAVAIRTALGPRMNARKPRAELIITAYRAANGRLSAADVERIVAEEIAAYMARVRQSKGFRHAG